MKKFLKLARIGFLSVALCVSGALPSHAALTFDANTITTDGAFTLNGIGGSVYALGEATTSGTITIGGTAQTGALTVGQSTGTNIMNLGTGTGATTVNVGTGATNAKTVNIGTGAVANTIAIGSAETTTFSLTDDHWSVTAAGVATFDSLVSNGTTDITSQTNEDLTLTANGTGDLVFSVDSGSPIVISGGGAADTDITTGTNEVLYISPNGTGDTHFHQDNDTNFMWGIIATAPAQPVVQMMYDTATTLAAAATLTGVELDLLSNITQDGGGNAIVGLRIAVPNGDNVFEFEGGTADGFETFVTVTDPTADQTWTIPNFAVNAAFVGSTLTTNNVQAANSIWGISNGLVFEGATADGFEITLSPADAGANATVTIPATTGTLITTGDAGTVVENMLAASLAFDDGDLLDLSAVSITTTTEGLLLPRHATDCSLVGTAEGQVCWESDADVLYIGTGAAVTALTPSSAANNTWTGTNDFTFAGAENMEITHDAGAGANIVQMTVTPSGTAGTLQGIKIDQADSANANGIDNAIEIDNSDTNLTIANGVLFTSAGGVFTDAINASATEIVNAINIGANNIQTGTGGTVTFARSDTGTVTLSAVDDDATAAITLDAGGAAAITIGSADVTSITLIPDTDVTIRNGASGNVTLDFRDYADTADDDMAHVLLTANCTDATTGAEDCDLTIGVVEAGAAADTRFNIDADAGITLGSASNNLFTVTTDGTGDGEVVLPNESVSATEITNVTRAISIPLRSFIDCQTDAGADIGFDTTADALADYVNSATDGTGFVIRFDDTGASEDQGSEICSNFMAPPTIVDATSAAFRVRALKDAHTGATEVINCAVSVNGAALEGVGTVTTDQSGTKSYSCAPTIAALAANDSVSFYLSITSDGTMNDQVDVASVEFVYVSTQ